LVHSLSGKLAKVFAYFDANGAWLVGVTSWSGTSGKQSQPTYLYEGSTRGSCGESLGDDV